MREEINIQWFPGHMTKARRAIEAELKLVDVVCELVDARIPRSSRNPVIDELTAGKPRLIILNKTDKADQGATRRWSAYFKKNGFAAIETDAKTGKGTSAFPGAVRALLSEKIEHDKSRGIVGRNRRVMIAGIPNVGKSALINTLAHRKAAAVSDRPGVTRGNQWIYLEGGIDLLDTPGILWPKFDDRNVAERLAFTGAIKDDVLDTETLAANLCELLSERYRKLFFDRFHIEDRQYAGGYELLDAAARGRGFLIAGGERDITRCASVLLDEFRAGKMGRITLEEPLGN